MIIVGQFQNFQRFFSSKLVLKTVKNSFTALNHHEKGSSIMQIGVQRAFLSRNA
jgi:hypothetical protein